MAVFLEGEQLLNEIEMCGESSNEWQAQEKKDCLNFMLDAELTPPVCRCVLHVAMSFVPATLNEDPGSAGEDHPN